MSEGACGRLTLISAPAGFGKSVLVSQWSAEAAVEPAWLSIDTRDRNAARLAQHLVATLEPHGLDIDDDFVSLVPPEGDALGDALIDVLVESLHDLNETWLVLEDIDSVGELPMAEDLARLIREAPPTFHFVVTSRVDPSLPLHQLRAHGELTQLRADDLRFTIGETRSLIDELTDGRALTADQLAHLVARTEGWPVAVQLAALSLRSIDDVDRFIDRFAEDDRTVADFLSSEFLDRESEDARRFLIDVSVLEQLQPELCNAVVGRTDSLEMLESLERRGVFITRMPRRAAWYRCHRLVREFLRHDLRITQPERPRELLIRAADWWVAQGELAPAASCLVKGEAWDRLVDLITTHGPGLLDKGDAASVLEWIDAIPPSVRRTSVPLQLTQAALSMVVGRLSASSAIVYTLEEETTLRSGYQLAADIVLASLVEGAQPPASVLERAQRVLDRDPADFDASVIDIFGLSGPASMECYMSTTAARAYLLLDDAVSADRLLTRAEHALDGTTPRFQVHAFGTRALLDALTGRLIRAESAARRGLELASQHVAKRHPARITPLLALAIVARSRNELSDAGRLIAQTCDDAERWRRWPWVGLLRAEEAQLEADQGRPERAVEVVRGLAQTSAPPPSPLVASRLCAAEARALLMLGDREVAQRLVDDPVTRSHSATAAVRVLLAVTSNDRGWARKELDNWPAESAPIDTDEHEMWSAVVDAMEGEHRSALDRTAAIVSRAEREGHIRLFLDAGPDGVRLVRELHRAQPRPYTRRILDAAATRPKPAHAAGLVEQLSARELAVLRYLPTRMAYGDIARQMFVSVNTLKTHVRHISQKLGVSGRDAAVARAEELGLL